jgi:hypothetical protein
MYSIVSMDGILSTIFGVEQFIGGTKINFDWQEVVPPILW